MTTLVKDTKVTYVPGSPAVPASPGRPARPAYCTSQTVQRCGFYQVPNQSTSGGTVSGSPAVSYQCRNVVEMTCYPAQPEVAPTPGSPGTPEQVSYDYNLGWNAGARSNIFLSADGGYLFTVPQSVVGVIVGLNSDDLGAGYFEIDHALYFSNGIARVLENGVEKANLGAYTGADEWRIERIASTVLYKKNTSVAYVSAVPSAGTVFLDASLYSGGDSVICPSIYVVERPRATLPGGGVFAQSNALRMTLAKAGGVLYASARVNGQITAKATFSGGGVISKALLVAGTRKARATLSGGGTLTGEIPRNVASMSMEPMTMLATGGYAHYAQASMSMEPMTITASGGVFTPSYANAALSFAFMTVSGIGLTGEIGGAAMSMQPMELLGADHAYGGAAMSMEPMQLYAYGENASVATAASVLAWFTQLAQSIGDVSDQAGASDSVAQEFGRLASDGLYAADTVLYEVIVQAMERLAGTSSASTQVLASLGVADAALLTDAAQVLFEALASESMSSSESLSVVLASFAIETILALDTTANRADVVNGIAEACVIAETITQGFSLEAVENAGLEDSLAQTVLAVAQVLDAASLSDSSDNTLSAITLVSDTASLADSFASQLNANQLAGEAILAIARITLDGTEYVGIVLNTEGLQPSEYANWDFNSFARDGDTFYGAKEDGIYVLEGDTDQGAQIAFYLKTGRTDFGSAQLKGIDAVYLGYNSSGDVRLKVITSENGLTQENWYALSSAYSGSGDAPDAGRVKTGKGLRSRYWAFEITNMGGADLSLYDMKLLPVIMKRKV